MLLKNINNSDFIYLIIFVINYKKYTILKNTSRIKKGILFIRNREKIVFIVCSEGIRSLNVKKVII